MQVDGTKLKLPTYEIKSREGTYGSGVLSLDKLSTELRVGGLKFPLAQLQKLTLEEDGILTNIDNRLLITLGGVVWTANTVILEVTQNLTAGQTAAFSIQYGGNFYSMTNLINQKIVIPHIAGAQLVITAINFITGAIDVETLTPVPGQAYTLSSVSASTVEGELKNVCLQEDWDYENAPIKQIGIPSNLEDVKTNNTLGGTPYNYGTFFYRNGTFDEVLAWARSESTLFDLQNYPSALDIANVKSMLSNRYRLEHSQLSYTAGGERPDLTVDDPTLGFIQPGIPFKVPANQVLPGNYYTFSIPGVVAPSGERFKLDFILDNEAVVMQLEPGETYLLTAVSGQSIKYFDYLRYAVGSDATNGWNYNQYQSVAVQLRMQLFGPLAKICVRTEAIDTRRDVHTIVLTVTPIN